jgi:hypothetical protein
MRPYKAELIFGVLGGVLLAFSATLIEHLPGMEEPARAGRQSSIQPYGFSMLIFDNAGCSR